MTAMLINRSRCEKRIEKGAALLAGIDPDWWKTIDPASLAMDDEGTCPVGQLFGDYATAIATIFEGHPDPYRAAAEHGFDVIDSRELYATLAVVWRADILDRKENDGKRSRGRRPTP